MRTTNKTHHFAYPSIFSALLLKVVLEANLEVFSAFLLLSKLVKYYSKMCKIFLTRVKLYVDYKNIIQFFIKCKEFMEFEKC